MAANISVIIPCYNCENTIERSVKSITEQTIKPSEVILVDDCSTDNTLKILLALKEKYEKGWIKILKNKENSGPGTSRNNGIEMAKGKYIAFLDADDSWHPQKVEIQYNWMEKNPDAFLTAHNSANLKDNIKDFKLQSKDIKPLIIKKEKVLFSNPFPTRSVIMKNLSKYRFLHKKRFSEDYLLWLDIIFSGEICFKFNEVLAFDYKHSYAEKGLGSHLWKMEKGELHSYYILLRKKNINYVIFSICSFFSILKFFRRVIITFLWKNN